MIDVEWAPTSSSVFLVQIQVEALDRSGLLSDVTRVLSREPRQHHLGERVDVERSPRPQSLRVRDGRHRASRPAAERGAAHRGRVRRVSGERRLAAAHPRRSSGARSPAARGRLRLRSMNRGRRRGRTHASSASRRTASRSDSRRIRSRTRARSTAVRIGVVTRRTPSVTVSPGDEHDLANRGERRRGRSGSRPQVDAELEPVGLRSRAPQTQAAVASSAMSRAGRPRERRAAAVRGTSTSSIGLWPSPNAKSSPSSRAAIRSASGSSASWSTGGTIVTRRSCRLGSPGCDRMPSVGNRSLWRTLRRSEARPAPAE